MRRCSTSSVIREKQNKMSTKRYQHTPTKMADVLKQDQQGDRTRTLLSPWEEYKMVQPLWKSLPVSYKVKPNSPYVPAIPIPVTREKCKTCAWMSKATWLSTALKWKQPKCPPSGEWSRTSWSIHTVEYYWVIKRNKPVKYPTTWMDVVQKKQDITHYIL